MSYQVLARKWRPKTFADVVGQTHILTALANGLRENRLHHAYLFSGTRGVGKTSIARLLAKGLNCVNGVTAEPCGICEHCKAIEEGHFIDLIEIDAASRTKVEDTRELLDNVQYKPVQGRYKVYLIDEVHMLSRHSFNALLKTLEEPPEYVKFLLATTDPQKLPITILSRCMQFHLKALEPTQIAQHLEKVLTEENIPFEPFALDKLAKAAQGSIRDSLSLTDQAIAMSNSHITLDVVNTMLGLLDDKQPIDILYALQQGNGDALMKSVQAVADRGGDWEELLNAITEHLHQIAMSQLLPSSQMKDDGHIAFLAKHISPEDVQFFYQIILAGRKELALAPNRRIGVEMILLRALAFHPKLISSNVGEAVMEERTESAVQSSTNLIDMPVVSQTIKSNYSAQHQGIPHQKVAALSSNIAPKAEQQRESSLMHTVNNNAISTLSSHSLDAIAALDALAQLDKNTQGIQAESEKKNAKPLTEKLSSPPVSSQERTLPIVNSPIMESKTQTEGVSHKKPIEIISEDLEENDEKEENEEPISAENYRWEWINPEMAIEQQAIRPSEIKQAILKNMTPELHCRIIDTARAQDDWTDLIEKIAISGLTKEMAMNSVIEKRENGILTLRLLPEKEHLYHAKTVATLQQALEDFYAAPIQLQVSIQPLEGKLTPLDYRNKIYQEFSEQTKHDLQQDPKLAILNQEFNAVLELDSIRPV